MLYVFFRPNSLLLGFPLSTKELATLAGRQKLQKGWPWGLGFWFSVFVDNFSQTQSKPQKQIQSKLQKTLNNLQVKNKNLENHTKTTKPWENTTQFWGSLEERGGSLRIVFLFSQVVFCFFKCCFV